MRAAFYECDVTPPLGGYMPGYGRKQIADDVFERLYSKALVIENDGEYVAIIAIDTCGMPGDMHDIVTKRIYEYTGIKPENISISSNHTHRGAPISDTPEIKCYADSTYRDVFYRLTADAAILAYKRLEESEVKIKFGKVTVPGICYCRNGELADGTYMTHIADRDDVVRLLGDVDEDLSVVYFEKDNKPIGAIINYSCHQDTTGGVPGYSGDFASVMSEHLKEKYGQQFVSLFLLGACGDVNANEHGKEKKFPTKYKHRIIGKMLADGCAEAINSAEEIKGTIGAHKEKIVVKKREESMEDTIEKIKRNLEDKKIVRSQRLLFYATTNDTSETELYMQGIKIGDILLSFFPGEQYVNTGRKVKENSPFKANIIVELSNSPLGYVPTKDLYVEQSNLYEMTLSYGSNLVPEASEIFAKKALEIADKLYN